MGRTVTVHCAVFTYLSSFLYTNVMFRQKIRVHLHELSRTGKSTETEHIQVVSRGWEGRENGERLLVMGTGFPFGVIKMF